MEQHHQGRTKRIVLVLLLLRLRRLLLLMPANPTFRWAKQTTVGRDTIFIAFGGRSRGWGEGISLVIVVWTFLLLYEQEKRKRTG